MAYPKPPKSFLTVNIFDISVEPFIHSLCVGYENGLWRDDAFAKHVIAWLPEFCLTESELKLMDSSNATELMRKAVNLVYDTEKYEKRGEFGEVFLHIALRQIYQTIPAISKIYYKDAVNNTVKGFDAVHVVETPEGAELWLGEVKFYTDSSRAIRDVVEELIAHTKIDYLRNEKILIANKLDKDSHHYEWLSKLLDDNTSLDEVFDVVCIPILITYNSQTVSRHSKTTFEYKSELEKEVLQLRDKIKSKLETANIKIKIVVFLIPLLDKADLIDKLHKKLRGLQACL